MVGLVTFVYDETQWIVKALALGIQAMDAMRNKCLLSFHVYFSRNIYAIEIAKYQMWDIYKNLFIMSVLT